MKQLASILALFSIVIISHGAGSTLILNGKLQSDLNANGNKLTNVVDVTDANGNSLLSGSGSGITFVQGSNIMNGAGGVIGTNGTSTTFKFSTSGTNDISSIARTMGDARYDAINSALAVQSAMNSQFQQSNTVYRAAFDTNGAASAVDGTHGIVYQNFSASTNVWSTNWVSDSGHQMLRLPSGAGGGGFTPLVVTNFGTTNFGLGAMTGTNWSQAATGSPFVYLSVSNSPAFDVLGMNIKTVSYPAGTNLNDWGALFLISSSNLFDAGGSLNLNSAYLHIGVAFGVNPNVGVIFATNNLLQGVGYSASIPQSILDTFGGANAGSSHNVEVRRVKTNSMTVVIDGQTAMAITDTNLPNFWGTNCIWEFAAFSTQQFPASADRSRTFIQKIYSARMDNSVKERAASYALTQSQFQVVDGVASIMDGATILGSIHPTNQVILGTGVGSGALSYDPFWGAVRATASLGFVSSHLKIQGSAAIDQGLSVGGSDGSAITMGAFGTPVGSPGTNFLQISGVNLGVGFPTNNTPGFSVANGSFVTTTNGDAYVTKAGNQVRLATLSDISGSGNGDVVAANNLSEYTAAQVAARANIGALSVTNGLEGNLVITNTLSITNGSVLDLWFSSGQHLRTNSIAPFDWWFYNTNGTVTMGTNNVTKYTIAKNGDLTLPTANGGTLIAQTGNFSQALFAASLAFEVDITGYTTINGGTNTGTWSVHQNQTNDANIYVAGSVIPAGLHTSAGITNDAGTVANVGTFTNSGPASFGGNTTNFGNAYFRGSMNGSAAGLSNMPFTSLSFNVASNAFTNVIIGYLRFTNTDGRAFTIGVGTNLP